MRVADNPRMFYTCPYQGNSIGSTGAQALAESLKQNSTLSQLNLERMSQFWDCVCMRVVGIRLMTCGCLHLSVFREQD